MVNSLRSIGDVISTVLPRGSLEYSDEQRDKLSERDMRAQCPLMPTDIFAVAGYLLKTGGVMAFFDPSPYTKVSDLLPCHFIMTEADRKAVDKVGRVWGSNKDFLTPPSEVKALWQTLIEAWDQPIVPGVYISQGGAPEWWSTALRLCMITDMACDRLLRDRVSKAKWSAFNDWFEFWFDTELDSTEGEGRDEEISNGNGADKPERRNRHGRRPPASLGLLADQAVVCVLPKVRVSPVGATLRNVTRNLALLPGKGEVRVSWYMPWGDPLGEDEGTLDILLIPEPRELEAQSFREHVDEGIPLKKLRYYKRDWQTFTLRQDWLCGPDGTEDRGKVKKFLLECCGLLTEAKKQSRCVNGIVLPEYALTFRLFRILCFLLKRHEPELEFVIAGSSDNCIGLDEDQEPEPGNHVLTRVWYDRKHNTTSRRKHHKWRMDRSQVETYALSTALNPKIKHWWEDSPIGHREVHFHRLRERSWMSVLICEELARFEPCHEVLRSVAPNLIFALLLDGPQIKQRWPSQYAANLADDPGSSVLTFTSFGLINRANSQAHHNENRSVALWKDETGRIVEIEMPRSDGPAGILLSLWSEHASDRTITGKNSKVRSWRYSSHFPIRLKVQSGSENARSDRAC